MLVKWTTHENISGQVIIDTETEEEMVDRFFFFSNVKNFMCRRFVSSFSMTSNLTPEATLLKYLFFKVYYIVLK